MIISDIIICAVLDIINISFFLFFLKIALQSWENECQA